MFLSPLNYKTLHHAGGEALPGLAVAVFLAGCALGCERRSVANPVERFVRFRFHYKPGSGVCKLSFMGVTWICYLFRLSRSSLCFTKNLDNFCYVNSWNDLLLRT